MSDKKHDVEVVVAAHHRNIIIFHADADAGRYSWRNQIPELAKTHKVVAVDMRGYNLSSKPADPFAYNIDNLMLDIVELIAVLGYDNCDLVSHDWGGIVAWNLAMNYPERINKLVVMNCPNPIAFKKNGSFAQFVKSWVRVCVMTRYTCHLNSRHLHSTYLCSSCHMWARRF